MYDSLPLGPVENDSLIWHRIAIRKFSKDSAKAMHYTDSFFSPVDLNQISSFPKGLVDSPQMVTSIFTGHHLKAENYGQLKPAGSS